MHQALGELCAYIFATEWGEGQLPGRQQHCMMDAVFGGGRKQVWLTTAGQTPLQWNMAAICHQSILHNRFHLWGE